MNFLLSFVGLLPHIVLGFWIVHFLWKRDNRDLILVKIFLSAAVGLGFSSLVGFLWIWTGFPLSVFVMLEIAITIVLTVWMFFTHWAQWKLTFYFLTMKDRINYLWIVLLGAGFFLFVINLWIYSRQYPHGRPDAWINWNVVARFIYRGGANWQNTFFRLWDHPDYPLYMAIPNAITWIITNSSSTSGPVVYHFVLSLFAIGLLFSLVYQFSGFAQASLAAVLFMSLPFTVDNGMRQYADFPLSYLILAAGGLTLLYLNRKERGVAVLAGFLVGLAGWTKNEGLVTIVGFTFVWGYICFFNDPGGFRDYLLGLAFPLAIIVLFKLFLAPSNDLFTADGRIFDKIVDIDRYMIILREAGSSFWSIGEARINLVGLIMMYIVFIGRSKRKVSGLWLIGSVVFIQLSVYFVIYLVTPYDLAWHLTTSLSRLYSHVLALIFLWIFIWLKSPQELSPILKEKT